MGRSASTKYSAFQIVYGDMSSCHDMDRHSTLLALCVGNPPVTGGFSTQGPEMWTFDVFLDANKHTVKLLVTWDTTVLVWHHCKVQIQIFSIFRTSITMIVIVNSSYLVFVSWHLNHKQNRLVLTFLSNLTDTCDMALQDHCRIEKFYEYS